ncbi:pirin family protein [Acinetobacter sp. ESBL14]|uniref:pirin family protein n=1 Tax=Acinetobacter sp. ESBL14 TaxID=3077329 RepID=UPI002FC99FA2
MTKSVYHKASSRGHANHGWLDSRHTFSFANYQDPERMNFGVLRVINDDHVEPGHGFGVHGHDNMEIISIPLEGQLKHADSIGNEGVIHKGEIQVMSAGTGVRHSEMNGSDQLPVKFLQIWIFPRERNVTPRYDQKFVATERIHNQWQEILSPNFETNAVWIHQDAWFSLGEIDQGIELSYQVKKRGNGVYIFVLEGELEIILDDGSKKNLHKRDGFGVWETDFFTVIANSESQVLLMDIPMELS